MSRRRTLHAGADTYVNEAKPKEKFAHAPRLRVRNGSGSIKEEQILIRFKNPVPRNATVLAASIHLTQDGGSGATIQLTAKTAGVGWDQAHARWANKPSGIGTASTVTKVSPNDGAVWVFDVEDQWQDIVDGAKNLGFVIDSNSTSELKFYSMNASKHRPRLEVVFTTAPKKPTLLKPSYGYVASGKPVLSCDFTDYAGSTSMSAIQVQIDTFNLFEFAPGHPLFDSGSVPKARPRLNLATETAYVGIADGDTTYWRVRVKDGDGNWSPYSDSVPLKRKDYGTVTITAPSDPLTGTVYTFTPTIEWTYTNTQVHYRVVVVDAADPLDIIYDSGKIQDSEPSHVIPLGVLQEGGNYLLTVQLWDDIDREDAPGLPVYAQAQSQLMVAFDATLDDVETVLVEPAGDRKPWVDVKFALVPTADWYTIERDGVAIADGLEVGDLVLDEVVGGTQLYRWRDWTARPFLDHTYKVRTGLAATDHTSAAPPEVTVGLNVVGIWLGDPDTGQEVMIGGKGFTTAQDDLGATVQALGQAGVVRVVEGLSGLYGSVDQGLLRDRPEHGWTWDQLEATMLEFKSRPRATYRLVLGDLNIPVVLGDVKPAPHAETKNGQVLKTIDFSWWQQAEYPFDQVSGL